MLIKWLSSFRAFGNVNITAMSGNTIHISWNANYPSTWTIISPSCTYRDPINITHALRTYTYALRSSLYDCNNKTVVILKNEDLDIWRQYFIDI